MKKKIKICGLTTREDIQYINEAKADYAGFIQFVPKSKRNIATETAAERIRELDAAIQPVAVTVSPTAEQLRQIEAAGFAVVQIHGSIGDEVLADISIPVWKAFNVADLSDFAHYDAMEAVTGFVLDAQTPGSGKTFDWTLLEKLPATDKPILLAGGLNPDNVRGAIEALGDHIQGVDTSSGVENEDGVGKSRQKILDFVRAVRHYNK